MSVSRSLSQASARLSICRSWTAWRENELLAGPCADSQQSYILQPFDHDLKVRATDGMLAAWGGNPPRAPQQRPVNSLKATVRSRPRGLAVSRQCLMGTYLSRCCLEPLPIRISVRSPRRCDRSRRRSAERSTRPPPRSRQPRDPVLFVPVGFDQRAFAALAEHVSCDVPLSQPVQRHSKPFGGRPIRGNSALNTQLRGPRFLIVRLDLPRRVAQARRRSRRPSTSTFLPRVTAADGPRIPGLKALAGPQPKWILIDRDISPVRRHGHDCNPIPGASADGGQVH